MVLCNPHNPIGLVPDAASLAALAEIAARHDATIVADEVHGPLSQPETPYTPFLTVSDAAREHGVAVDLGEQVVQHHRAEGRAHRHRERARRPGARGNCPTRSSGAWASSARSRRSRRSARAAHGSTGCSRASTTTVDCSSSSSTTSCRRSLSDAGCHVPRVARPLSARLGRRPGRVRARAREVALASAHVRGDVGRGMPGSTSRARPRCSRGDHARGCTVS